jgi:hypothetical protein
MLGMYSAFRVLKGQRAVLAAVEKRRNLQEQLNTIRQARSTP